MDQRLVVVDGSSIGNFAEECDQSSNSSEQDSSMGVEKLLFSKLAGSPVRWPQAKRTVSPIVTAGTRQPYTFERNSSRVSCNNAAKVATS